MIRSWVTSPACRLSVSTVLPSRMTVTLSETAVISPSLCEIMMLVIPRSRSRRIRSSRCAESVSLSAAVGLGVGLVPVDEPAAAAPLVAQEHVLRDGQVGHQRELLVDDHDAHVLAVADAVEPDRLSVVDDLAVVAP